MGHTVSRRYAAGCYACRGATRRGARGWSDSRSRLRTASEWRSNKLTASEYDETTWSARTFMAFAAQRISVAVQLSMAQEVAEALGLSVAADPRAT